MSDNQFCFDFHDGSPAERPRLAVELARRLATFARRGVYLGTSSWKYPGWLGHVYDPVRYRVRGRFSQKRFDRHCLSEYATVFPTVCGDFSFYRFVSAAVWAGTLGALPSGFRFCVKVPEQITAVRYANLPRYGERAGKDNPDFMNTALLHDQLLSRLEPYHERLGPLIFQFGAIRDKVLSRPDRFAARLDTMLSSLPTERFTFAVEVRNRAFVSEASDYFACLRKHGIAHCLNSWTHMPSVAEQMAVADAYTATVVVARFLLRPGRLYNQAVEMFSPYERVVDAYPEGRAALRGLIERCLADRRTLFALVNNRLEGNAVETIESAIEPGRS